MQNGHSGRADTHVRLLGPPALLSNGELVRFPSRKAQALFFFLAANGGRRIDRAALAGLFWGSNEAELARTSLRKTLSIIGADPVLHDLVGRDRAHAWFAGDPTRSDLAAVNAFVGAGTDRAYREALQLWRGEPLAGLEIGEPTFDEWVGTYRADTVNLTLRMLGKRLTGALAGNASADVAIAVCELIARIDPTEPEANEQLIRLHADRGNVAAAARQLRLYDTALAQLELSAPRELHRYVATRRADPAPAAGRIEPPAEWTRPAVAIMRPRVNRPLPDQFSFAHAELIHQLSRFRTMRCYERDDAEPAPGPGEGTLRRVGLSDAQDHDYRLLIWDEPAGNSVYIRVINVGRQDTVSCVRLDRETLNERGAAEKAIAAALNSLEQDILSDVVPDRASAFSRWLEAYKLMTQFSPLTDRLALRILEDLLEDGDGRRLSLVHASVASILMIRRLVVPTGEAASGVDLDRARLAALKAIAIDELEPFNHVIAGWMRIQTGEHARALQSFDTALKLNPYSSRTLIAAAEANAYCGNLARADLLAARALDFSGRYMPAYYENYLANIAYLRGDNDSCVEHLRRGPENAQAALVMIAAHSERGDAKAVAAAKVCFERELRRTEPRLALDNAALSRWIIATNMTREDDARRRMFGSLARAGIPVEA